MWAWSAAAISSWVVLFSAPDVQLRLSVNGASQESILYRFVPLLLRFDERDVGLIVDSLSFRVSVASPTGCSLLK